MALWDKKTFVHELFLAESKSQVYGYLHQFLWDHPNAALHLIILYIQSWRINPVFITYSYNDCCHLHK